MNAGSIGDWFNRAMAPTSGPSIDDSPTFAFEGEPQPPLYTSKVNGGVQAVYRFANGYGASVVRHSFSYGREKGLWELAVLKFYGPGEDDWRLTYDTPVTSDVKGSLTDSDVANTLNEIASLPECAKGGK